VDPAGPLGWSGFHFPSTWWQDGTLMAFYIANQVVDDVGRSATGLATSTDGVTFIDEGVVLDIGGAAEWQWYADSDFLHEVGRAEAGGWSANVADDGPGYLTYGPYDDTLPGGPMTARFSLLVDDNSFDDLRVVGLDAFAAAPHGLLAQRDVTRTEFAAPWALQDQTLELMNVAGAPLELRTWYHDVSYLRLMQVTLAQGHAPWPDDRLASFPGVWFDGSEWTMAYEAAGTDPSWPGDIGLATSADGRSWVRAATNPILVHEGGGWESVNIGTPSLWYEDGTWYLFYHGFDGSDVRIGVATGPSLDALTRHPGNPILDTVESTWSSGTVGARSIRREGDTYYMAFEGSTDPPFDEASWSTGLARSTDLLTWEVFPLNPILPTTSASFGYDGPEWLETPDGALHLLFRHPDIGNYTWRATLTWGD
jgi:hypothetical protein